MSETTLDSCSGEELEHAMKKLVGRFTDIYVEPADYEITTGLETFDEPPKCHKIYSYNSKPNNSMTKMILKPSSLTPFVRTSIYGTKTDTIPINLTGDLSNEVLLTYENLISIYDYGERKDTLLYGHRNKIVSTAIDSSGKWLVTSDIGPNAMIIVWDITRRFPVHVIRNYNQTGCSYTKLTPCGRFLLTLVEKEETDIKILGLWDWPNKKLKPDVTIELNENDYGKIQQISFYFDRCDFIMLTTQQRVIFLTVKNIIIEKKCKTCQNNENNTIKKSEFSNVCICDELNINKYTISYHNPKMKQNVKNTGTYNDSVYIRGTTMALTGTSKGNIIVWSDDDVLRLFHNKPKLCNNNKNFVRILELDSQPINLIYNIEGRYVATVNGKGHITFYDNHLIVAYKLAGVGKGIPVNISFNLNSKENCDFNTMEEEDVYRETINIFDKKVKHYGKYNMKKGKKYEDVSDATIIRKTKLNEWKENLNPVYSVSNPKKQFLVRDFIITTDLGNIYYVNINHVELFEIKVICIKKPSVIDIHPNELKSLEQSIKALRRIDTVIVFSSNQDLIYLTVMLNLLIIGNKHGIIYLFDYRNVVLLNQIFIFDFPEESDPILEKEEDSKKKCITCLKYTSDGRYIGCGTGLGVFYLLHGKNLQILLKDSRSKFSIIKLMFSRLSTSLAFFDSNGEIYLYNISSDPMFIGKTKPHFMEMTDAMFFSWLGNNSLFTIGEDGYLMEFDIIASEDSRDLISKSSLCFEQFAKPCHLEISTDSTTVLLVFNNKMECRFVCVQTYEVICTVKGPSCGPVSFTQHLKSPLNSDEFIFYTAQENIGLIKLPFDGNPFRIISHRAAKGNVLSACIGTDREHVFSVTEDEGLVLWKLQIDVLNEMERHGGEDIQSYLKAIDLAPSGPSLENVQLMFAAVREIYIRNNEILDQSNQANLIPVVEVPNFIKSLGAFTSNQELNNLWVECLEDKSLDKNLELISFEKCLKLYYNYKYQLSYSEKEIKDAFECICQEYNSLAFEEKPCINKDDFLALLESEGFGLEESLTYLKELLHDQLEETDILFKSPTIKELPEDLSHVYQFMPCTMNYEYFITVLLGLSSLQLQHCTEAERPLSE